MRDIDLRARLRSFAETHLALFIVAAAPIYSSIGQPGRGSQSDVLGEIRSIEAEQAIKRFRTAAGMSVELFAAEPLVANPVSFAFDPGGRIYLVETHRRRTSVYDIRNHRDWVDDDFSFRTVEDRANFFKRVLTPDNESLPDRIRIDRNNDGVFDFHDLEVESERIRLIEDRDGNGRADSSRVFADGFNSIVSGVAAGVLVRPPNVWFTCIPDLWLLQDQNSDGRAESRRSILNGFGVHISYGGHDFHGLAMGPDGKLYFSIADRGFSVTEGGRTISNPDSGAVMRCNPDGTGFELIVTGLRNPQELAFDQFGNLWTGDNNGDGGDKARWVYVVEGGDSGWHYGWQHQPKLGPWNSERLWELAPLNTAAYVLPPIAHIGHGPAGLTFYPGTGMPSRYDNHFFMCDFPGGVHSFALRPNGSAYEVVDRQEFLWGLYPVDVDFGPEGGAYIADWIEGWDKTGKGRIYRVYDAQSASESIVEETRELLMANLSNLSNRRLARHLEHADRRVRMETQFALAQRGADAIGTLFRVASKNGNQLARLHAIWGLGQIGGSDTTALASLLPLFDDEDPEIRAQAAKIAGDGRLPEALDPLIASLRDANPRVRFFAALGLGKLRQQAALEPLFQMIRENADRDPYLRHAAVMGLVWINDMNALISAAKDDDPSVRLACLLAMRKLSRPEIAMFLYDKKPKIVLEAVRAIYDLPIETALSQVAALSGQLAKLPTFEGDAERGDALRAALLRRVINAHYRLGNLENCLSLTEIAAQPSLPEMLRTEALQLLRDWAKPPSRDHLLGLWRPLPERNARAASLALRSRLPRILRTAPDSVRVAAAQCAVQLDIRQAAPVLFELISESGLPPSVRIEALRSLIQLDDSRVREALTLSMADQNEPLRREATRWFAKLNPSDAIGRLAVTLEEGSILEKQTALASLSDLKSPIVDQIAASMLDQLRNKDLPPELQLDLLELAESRTAPIVRESLQLYRDLRASEKPAKVFPELLFGGDPEAGRRLFYDRADVACMRCHLADAEGGEVGPDLKGVGRRRTREYLLESILFPNKQIAEEFTTEMVTMNDGATFIGLRQSESDTELTLNSPEDGLLTLPKDQIQERKRGLSAMPEEIATILSKREIRDLIAFLVRLK